MGRWAGGWGDLAEFVYSIEPPERTRGARGSRPLWPLLPGAQRPLSLGNRLSVAHEIFSRQFLPRQRAPVWGRWVTQGWAPSHVGGPRLLATLGCPGGNQARPCTSHANATRSSRAPGKRTVHVESKMGQPGGGLRRGGQWMENLGFWEICYMLGQEGAWADGRGGVA